MNRIIFIVIFSIILLFLSDHLLHGNFVLAKDTYECIKPKLSSGFGNIIEMNGYISIARIENTKSNGKITILNITKSDGRDISVSMRCVGFDRFTDNKLFTSANRNKSIKVVGYETVSVSGQPANIMKYVDDIPSNLEYRIENVFIVIKMLE